MGAGREGVEVAEGAVVGRVEAVGAVVGGMTTWKEDL